MALVSLPPELRSLCRRLASTKAEQLPPLLPTLLKDVARCQEPLSRPLESKPSESSRDAADLVHKLKTQITSLLKGRTSQGRFVGAALAKAVVESGGWECLRASEPWAREMITIIQKKELALVKDICIVAVVKIFSLMHQYPTLVRETVTPNLSAFATACLQILKPPVSSKVGKAPYTLVETIFEAISTLIVLHPTTLRQSAAKFKSEIRPYLVPTISDDILVPASLQESSRRLAIRLHMTIAKGGDSTEWTNHVQQLVKTAHSTADQVFRAVQENWESTIGHKPQAINIDIEPQGGGGDQDHYPRWAGIQAGGERIIGLLDFIGDYLRYRTRAAVTIPITALTDITSRISSIKPPSPGREKSDAGQMNPAIGREEKDELWAVFPDIQIAVLRLHLALLQRLDKSYIPLAPGTLDQTLRIFQSLYRLPAARTTAFSLINEILQLCGPTLPKFMVEGLSLVIKCCCRDLLAAAGHMQKPKTQTSSSSSSSDKTNKKTISQDADAYLRGTIKAQDDIMTVSLDANHLQAANSLLTALFNYLPQQYIPSSLRTQMLRTAILCRNRDAQVASILHPARDRSSGRTPQVILPYLTRQFPRDESVEVLRFNFRPGVTGMNSEFIGAGEESLMEEDENEEEEGNKITAFPFGQVSSSFLTPAAQPTAPVITHQFKPSDQTANPTPFLTQQQQQQQQDATSIPLKRKNEDILAETSASKRVVAVKEKETVITTTTTAGEEEGSDDDDDDDDDDSVHLNMELDTDDSEDDVDDE
ncbi:rRNA processing/ribosome biogenesis-domain-containing protein [Poronia punctata]|nr:rRNA processing/ribosome biogenesis-domain-containing protein [Poronia punctata]